jgi:hypothetical protein
LLRAREDWPTLAGREMGGWGRGREGWGAGIAAEWSDSVELLLRLRPDRVGEALAHLPVPRACSERRERER